MSASSKVYRKASRGRGEIETHTFPRSRRLKRRRLIQSLFDRTRADSRIMSSGAVRILYRRVSAVEIDSTVPVQIGFAIGRSAGNAVTRNRIKRLLREEYRLNRTRIESALSQTDTRVILMVVLRHNLATPEELRNAFRDALLKLVQRESAAATGEGMTSMMTEHKTEQPR